MMFAVEINLSALQQDGEPSSHKKAPAKLALHRGFLNNHPGYLGDVEHPFASC
jgi:hypothetical protein